MRRSLRRIYDTVNRLKNKSRFRRYLQRGQITHDLLRCSELLTDANNHLTVGLCDYIYHADSAEPSHAQVSLVVVCLKHDVAGARHLEQLAAAERERAERERERAERERERAERERERAERERAERERVERERAQDTIRAARTEDTATILAAIRGASVHADVTEE